MFIMLLIKIIYKNSKKINLVLLLFSSLQLNQLLHAEQRPNHNNSKRYNIFKISPMTVLEPGKTRFQNTFYYYHLKNQNISLLTNELEYALSRHQTVQITTPFVLGFEREDQKIKRGIGKIQIHTDIRWFIQEHFASLIRLGLELPTTNIKNSTLIGFNSTDIILEFENVFFTDSWFVNFVAGPLITTKANNKKRGLQFSHSLDFAKVFPFKTAWSPLTLFIGTTLIGGYGRPNSFNDVTDPNSGFYVLAFGPLFSISNSVFLVDFRAQFPVSQHLFGIQNKLHYIISSSLQLLF